MSGLGTFFVRRLITLVLVLGAVSVITFAIFIEIPGGDPAIRLAGRDATAQNVINIRKQWGFDRPIYVQYGRMMEQALTGRLTSYVTNTNVRSQILRGIPATLSLAFGAGLIWLTFGVLAGVLAALRAGRFTDRAVTSLALVGVSLPVFWIGVETRYLFSEKNGWLPDGQYVPLTHNPAQWAWHLLLPWCVLASVLIGVYGRVLRSNILDAIWDDHVTSARARGLSGRRVFLGHVLRNSLIPIVSLFGLDFASVAGGGTILTEQVFDLHGVGQYTADAIGSLDLPPIMGVMLYAATTIVVLSMIVDFAYSRLDPRIGLR